MYPKSFDYYRARSIEEAVSLLEDETGGAQLLAGGQSLIPLLKLRMSQPNVLIDINFIDGLSYISRENGSLRFGAMTRHNDVARSGEVAEVLPMITDCAGGIADDQIRNRGTVGGSIAEADPSGDWSATLLTLETRLKCKSPDDRRTITLDEFFEDAFSTALGPHEMITEIIVDLPPQASGGAFMAFKRSPQVYASASVAARVTMENGQCRDADIALGCVGLTTIKADEAAEELEGSSLSEETVEKAASAAREASNPQPDQRGSAQYKKDLIFTLTQNAVRAAHKRSRGDDVEVTHRYALRS